MINLQFWRSAALKPRCQQGCISSEGIKGELVPCIFSFCMFPRPVALHLQSQQQNICKSPSLSACVPTASVITSPSLTLTLLPFSYKDSCDYTGSADITKDNLLISRSLPFITSEKTLLLLIWGLEYEHLWGAVTLDCFLKHHFVTCKLEVNITWIKPQQSTCMVAVRRLTLWKCS